MKTTFKKINPRYKLELSTYSRYDYKSANYNNNKTQKFQPSTEDYKIGPSEEKYYFLRLWEEGPLNI